MDKIMKSGLVEKVGEAISNMAKALGVASEHVYKVLVQQMFVEGLVGLIIGILSIVVLSLLYFVPLRKMNKYVKKNEGELAEFYYPYMIFGGVILTFIVLLIMIHLQDDLLHMMNPQYYAIKEILKAIK